MQILAVDDDPIILELLQHFVTAFGDHVLTIVDCPLDALDLLCDSNAVHFDCFLLDIQMPKMTGIELVEKIRQIPTYVDTPVLMLTAMTDRTHIDAAFKAGATDYVTKPFEVNELRGRINLLEAIAVSSSRPLAPNSSSWSAEAQPLAFNDPIALHDPLSVYDVENFIDHAAMENYIIRLSRSKLFGSTSFSLGIRAVEMLHNSLTPYEFHSLIADVAEVISDTLKGCGFLMTYAGGGIYVGIADCNWRPQTEHLMDSINIALSQADLADNAGARLEIRVSAGRAVRLAWKASDSILESLADAYTSAEDACQIFEESRNDFWFVGKTG